MVIDQVITDNYAIYNGDSAEVLKNIPDNSIHLSVYSPPFAIEVGRAGCLYHYSSSSRDLSNCRNYEEFFEHYRYIVSEISRVMMPGRISAVHCMDIPKDGANICGYTDFPGRIIKLHEELGFEYLPRISIWKEPLAVRNRTMSKSLAHRQIIEDSTLTSVASSDYLIPFRKKGKNPIPVSHPNGLMEYAGATPIPEELKQYRGHEGNQIENRYSHWIWRQYASSIWDDIRLDHVCDYEEAIDEEDERHVHPLQLDIIERACVLWSNPGEIVLDPFGGVGSIIAGSVQNNRKAILIELKPTYYRQAIRNAEKALEEQKTDDQLVLL
jgi:DNA modification methylase